MKAAIAFLAGLAAASDQVYLEFLSRYGKSYETREEYEFR